MLSLGKKRSQIKEEVLSWVSFVKYFKTEKECLVGHLPLLTIAGFTELAIYAMVVLGFQTHPQFTIAETLQWCSQLELQRTWRRGEDVLDCNFFKWCYKEGADERDAIIVRQR
ncbi:hypothetical protein DEO72_LG1g1252 [Vigna unguiculata]|uniref:Uncharacterized protein n=1 Tax=Vigna unguiculata TaxID=3917 RepID=A0A4D6KIB8_VIGUN|nr:hypothetical protein DEO72_LG1g1252 [Vigna unguiculata]